MSNLETHEIQSSRRTRAIKRKKSVAFKVSSGSSDDEEEIMSMIVRKIGRMFYKKG